MFLGGGGFHSTKTKNTGRFHFLSNIFYFSSSSALFFIFYFYLIFFGLLWPALVNNSNVAHIGIIILLLWSPNSQQQRLQQKKTMWYLVREREKEMLNNTFCVFVWVNEMMMARDIIIIIIIDSMVSLGCLVCVCIWVSFGAWSESQRRAFSHVLGFFFCFFLSLDFCFLNGKKMYTIHVYCILLLNQRKKGIFFYQNCTCFTHTRITVG